MADTQVVRLKKEIEVLREHNVQLKAQVEEQAEHIGQLEYQHLNIMNKNLMLQEEKKISEDSSKLERIISSALTQEKQKNEALKKQNEKLTKDLNYYKIQRGIYSKITTGQFPSKKRPDRFQSKTRSARLHR